MLLYIVASVNGPTDAKLPGAGATDPGATGPLASHRSLTIPATLLPRDGRFGSGPSKVRAEAVEELASRGVDWLGTSHRREGVRSLVGQLRSGLAELFGLPDGTEVLLGNGGTTSFWDAASFGLINARSQHLCFGEFSDKFSKVTAAAPHLEMPDVIASEPGTHPHSRPPAAGNPPTDGAVDAVALTHNETSTGVCAPVLRPDWTSDSSAATASDSVLTLVDATSAAGAIAWDVSQADCYYFAPQKAFAGDGGLWVALCAPAAIERIERLSGGASTGAGKSTARWAPASLDLSIALTNSRQNQTYNTPALATLLLMNNTLQWMLSQGGLEWSTQAAAANSSTIYNWAQQREWCQPFVADADMRSPVVCTIDFDDSVSADDIAAVLRENGIVDTEGYRKLNRNQLRIAAFPAIELADVEALCACIDYVVEQLAS